jgi:hypothetical protein
MKSLGWKVLILLVLLVPLLVWAYDRMLWTYGVGSTDLTIEYHVVDATTGHAMPAARIDFRDDEGVPAKSYGFILANNSGHAQHQFPNSMVSTQHSGLNWTVRVSIALPSWSFSVSAPGYAKSEWHNLFDHRFETVRDETNQARLVIPIRLKKDP